MSDGRITKNEFIAIDQACLAAFGALEFFKILIAISDRPPAEYNLVHQNV